MEERTRCEICGRVVNGRPKVVKVEGSELRVCEECAKFGRKVVKPGLRREERTQREQRPRRRLTGARRRPRGLDPFSEGLEVVPDYDERVREARERRGWSQKDLARKIGEKVSVIRRIESGKMEPDVELARKLERVLEIELLERVSEEDTGSVGIESDELTLGDVVEIRKK
ncbi:multiprotein bridging factor aMBF1 [Methanopyrus sp. KOL6]|uniref:multiprotein bridging factor aMBF1 n=1 Tax=Methanopyrus sp. KOL6 TaxID=1937004 RepID=UPI000B4ABA7B|nr:multiprotein bridging factor aMBF1 [Methanopyrus sp. KOL6]